jgi:hypothetical protein
VIHTMDCRMLATSCSPPFWMIASAFDLTIRFSHSVHLYTHDDNKHTSEIEQHLLTTSQQAPNTTTRPSTRPASHLNKATFDRRAMPHKL